MIMQKGDKIHESTVLKLIEKHNYSNIANIVSYVSMNKEIGNSSHVEEWLHLCHSRKSDFPKTKLL